ncbi:hypothetical protein TNCV_911671 [Trichonephila clavipes]|nr:hypothetical protein TNCV_911671 [Trichonephila clavipes]
MQHVKLSSCGVVGKKVGRDRKRALTSARGRYWVLNARRHKRATAPHLVRDLAAVSGRRISRSRRWRDDTPGRGISQSLLLKRNWSTLSSLLRNKNRQIWWQREPLCGGIMVDSRISLYVFDVGTVNSQWYRNDILEAYVRKSGKKKLSLQDGLNLLPNLPTDISDVLTDDFSDEEVPANNPL